MCSIVAEKKDGTETQFIKYKRYQNLCGVLDEKEE